MAELALHRREHAVAAFDHAVLEFVERGVEHLTARPAPAGEEAGDAGPASATRRLEAWKR